MIFSQTAEYALRAIVWLAAQGEAPRTTQQIAANTTPVRTTARQLRRLRTEISVSAPKTRAGMILTMVPAARMDAPATGRPRRHSA